VTLADLLGRRPGPGRPSQLTHSELICLPAPCATCRETVALGPARRGQLLAPASPPTAPPGALSAPLPTIPEGMPDAPGSGPRPTGTGRPPRLRLR